MQEDKWIEEYVDIEEGPQDWRSKIMAFWDYLLQSKYFYLILVILLMTLTFLLGRISLIYDKRESVKVLDGTQSAKLETKDVQLENSKVLGASTQSGQVVASKSGTKYHYPWCAGAKQISEKNKIFFNSISEARAKGYTPASNCKGLE